MGPAIFYEGHYQVVEHTPEDALEAGDVLIVGALVLVAHSDVAADTLGAFAACGGVYKFPKTAGSGTAYTGGAKVYWDADPGVITATSSGNTAFGYTTPAGAGDDDLFVYVLHTTF